MHQDIYPRQCIAVLEDRQTERRKGMGTYTLFRVQWNFDSGRQRYTSLMKTRISKFVPDCGDRPTTKTTDVGALVLLKKLGQNLLLWQVAHGSYEGRPIPFQRNQ